MESGAVFEENKSRPSCDICHHKKELTSTTHVCKQCRLFLCHACCSTHISLDHAIMELGRVIEARDLADVSKGNKTQTASVEADDDIVDSDYECQGGLSSFMNATENATLTKVAEFEASSNVQSKFCLQDGRICFHQSNEIIIYSKDYTRQFAIESSPLFGVIHTGGNTIAILDFELNIERLKITETDAKVIDNVRLVLPSGICSGKPSVKKLSRMGDKPAFFFGDGQYSLIFPEMLSEKVPVWCTFSLDGKPSRKIFLSGDFKARFGCQNHHNMYIMKDWFYHGHDNDDIITTFNQQGGYKEERLPSTYKRRGTLMCMYTDGDYAIYLDKFETSEFVKYGSRTTERRIIKFDLIIFEIESIKTRIFSDFTDKFSSIFLQNSLDRIIIRYASDNKYTVLGLSQNKK